MPDERIVDGQLDWSGGVNGSGVKTIASQNYPNGIKRNQLSWLANGTVRGSGITQRTGWQPIVQGAPWSGLFQGAFLYEPDFAAPHLVLAIGGELWRVRVDTDNSILNLSTAFGSGLTMPPDEPQAFFAQSELFLIWQCGDLTTKPIFYWDDADTLIGMRRSNGFVGVANPTNEIPPAGPMSYQAQRTWYAIGRFYGGSDIVLNPTSGSAPFGFRDSVLKVTENPVANSGDGFVVPTTAGNIRALKFASNLDSALGESNLFIFTRRSVYSCLAPITRDDWTNATLNTMPLQKVALAKGGTYSERSVVQVNGDLFFQSPPNGDIRSFQTTLRYQHQWGNVPISRNENRILQFNDRSMLRYASGIEFDNRLWQTSTPVQTPAGVGFRTVLPLDFDLISSLEERLPPAWEGHYEGLSILQLVEGDFGGRERAFAIVWSDLHQAIEVWELTVTDRFENGENRVSWAIETPAYTWGNPFALKQLETAELWIDKLLGTVDFQLYYKPDQWPCWIEWHAWQECSAKSCIEDSENPCVNNGYPTPAFCESFRANMTLPKPPLSCIVPSSRPSNIGYQFQIKLIIKGWCRVRGLLAYALPKDKRAFESIVC